MDCSQKIIPEKNLQDYPHIVSSETTEVILSQMKRNICKIHMVDGTKGTGFFCKIAYPEKKYSKTVFITNNHIIDEDHLREDTQITYSINNDTIKNKLIIGKRNVFTSKKYDVTIIEIFEEKDNIHDYLFLDFDINEPIFNDIYLNQSIYILQYPNNGKVSVSYGTIKNIDLTAQFNFRHLCCTEKGSSGSPILNLSNNKLIGIHRGTDNNYNYNIGTLLIYPIKEFISQLKEKEKNENLQSHMINNNNWKNKNVIKGVLDVKLNEINKDIVLFNTDIKEGINVYLNHKQIIMSKNVIEWKIHYDFIKEGKYSFEIVFNSPINNVEGFFEDSYNIISLDLSYFDTSNITNMRYMFNRCNILKEIKGINKIKTNKVTDMEGMFQSCRELEYLDLSNFDSSNVTKMGFMFNKCSKLKEIKGINKIKTNKVTDMEGMFQLCSELEYLDLSNFDSSNVTKMGFMFNKCSKLKEIKGINNCIINKVTDMEGMFQLCSELEYLDLTNFDTSNVTSMSCMFAGCNKLKKIKGINNFKTNNVINMEAMFQLCSELEYLDLSNFDTSNVTNMAFMFNKCIKLKLITGLNKFITNQVVNMKLMFNECNELEYL